MCVLIENVLEESYCEPWVTLGHGSKGRKETFMFYFTQLVAFYLFPKGSTTFANFTLKKKKKIFTNCNLTFKNNPWTPTALCLTLLNHIPSCVTIIHVQVSSLLNAEATATTVCLPCWFHFPGTRLYRKDLVRNKTIKMVTKQLHRTKQSTKVKSEQ